jgi:hypothetical protein
MLIYLNHFFIHSPVINLLNIPMNFFPCALMGLFILIVGCSVPYYRYGSKNHFNRYQITSKDTLILNDYVLKSSVARSAPFSPLYQQDLSEDSIINLVQVTFANNNIPIKVDDKSLGINYRDSINLKRLVRPRNVNIRKIINAIDDGYWRVIPIIDFNNEVHFTGYVTSNLMAGNDGFLHNTHFTLLIYLYKGKELVYYSCHRYFSTDTKVSSFDEGFETPSGVSIKQEHWDELVRRTMRGYFKQVGR